jgi:hypothetical protein
MIEYVDVVDLKWLDGYRVWLRFSNGREGIRDFSDLISMGGEMVEPLKDVAVFSKVFLSYEAPTWPNGFDIDPTNLHLGMSRDGLLSSTAAAE